MVPWSRLGDESLAGRAAKGNGAAFTALYERYYGPLLGYTRSILLDAEDASDATQSALENALRALPRRDSALPLRPWLYRIAHNEAIAIVRRRRPQTELTPALEPTIPGPEVDAEQRGRITQLVDDLRSLPERQRGALVMRELSGLSYAEIGTALDLSVEAARRAVFDARSSLHDAADGRATECVTVRHRISDGDRRGLRARAIRAHLRSCDDCASFRRSIDARRSDLHVLAPWASGAAVMGALGGGTFLAGGGAVASGGISWATMPVAIKGVAVAAAVATTGTAAVEIKHAAEPDRATSAKIAQPRSERAEAQAMRQATRAARSAARTAPAAGTARVTTPPRSRADSRSGGATRAERPEPPTAIAPVTAAPTPVPAVAVTRSTDAAPRLTPRQRAARKLRPLTDRVQQVLLDAKALAAGGTQGALALASKLLHDSLNPLLATINRILKPLGITLPAIGASSASASGQAGLLGSIQQLLGGVEGLLAKLLGKP